MADRYDITPLVTGAWAVVHTATNLPVMLDGMPLTGLDLIGADELCDALNAAEIVEDAPACCAAAPGQGSSMAHGTCKNSPAYDDLRPLSAPRSRGAFD